MRARRRTSHGHRDFGRGADDGVMPANHRGDPARAGGQGADRGSLNKMDKPEADAEKVKQELTKYGVIPEEWGGENNFRAGLGADRPGRGSVIDSILLQAEVLELKGADHGLAAGYVIESSLEKGRGAVATVLVLRGTLKLGDPLLIGQEFGRVRALFDEAGHAVDSADLRFPWWYGIVGCARTPATNCWWSRASARRAKSPCIASPSRATSS